MAAAGTDRYASVLDEDLSDVGLSAQLACVKREVALRQNAYPKWVAGGRLTQREADKELRAMRAVLKTLLQLQATIDGTGGGPSFL